MDVAGNTASMLLIASGTITDTQTNNGTQDENGTDTGGDDESPETNSLIIPLILVVIGLSGAIIVLQGTRRPSSDDVGDGHSDTEKED